MNTNSPDTFKRGFLSQPAVKRLLATWPDPEPIPVEKSGPRQCCAEFAVITTCTGERDVCFCGICNRTWIQPCSVGDFAVEG